MPVTTRSQAKKQQELATSVAAPAIIAQPPFVIPVTVEPPSEANIYNSNGYTNLMNAIQICDLNLVKRYLSEPKTHLNDTEDIFTRYGYFATKHMNPSNTLDIARVTSNTYKRYYSALYRIKNENKTIISLNGKFLNALKNNNFEAFMDILKLNYDRSYFNDPKIIEEVEHLINEPLLNINIYKPLDLALEMAKKSKIIYDMLVSAGAKHSKYT
jgi:hypothetical protein